MALSETPTAAAHPLNTWQTKGFIALFFISGASALCYQLIWQRILFATFGINIESVTIIVSLFMFGLGIGALLGAKLQRFPQKLLFLFVAFEIAIGFFGLASKPLIDWLGGLPAIDSLWMIAAATYAIFAIPTLLMGATLPLLVGYINRTVAHTGKSTSLLYASNTLGAAAAAFLIVECLFVFFGLQAVIHIAVGLNWLTAASALLLCKKRTDTLPPQEQPATPVSTGLSRNMLLMAGFAIGYISLSQELVWFRLLGFISANKPTIFGLLLAVFLMGIAFASLKANDVLSRAKHPLTYVLGSLLGMALLWYVSFPLISYIAAYTGEAGKKLALGAALIFAGANAYFSGIAFPILCHFLQEKTGEPAGRAVGKLYFANVMGATLGPLLTGFVLFEYISFEATILLLGLATALLVIALAAKSRPMIACAVAVSLIGAGLHATAYDTFLEKLLLSKPSAPFDAFSSNRSGFISVVGDSIYGNGAYDGKMNLDADSDTSAIIRAYAVPAFHPDPKRILQIGTSGGSWATVLSMYEPMNELVSIEINKGYFDIIGRYPDHAVILNHPKIKFAVDDGRRWLRNNPDEKFDVIISNTIYHWRSNATNMLSREFMEMCKKHLNPGGYIFMIDTEAPEVAYTAAHVFTFVNRNFGNMVIAGDTPPPANKEQIYTNMLKFIGPDGQPLLAHSKAIHRIADIEYPNQRDEILQQNLLVITDDNMATEFKK